MYWYENRMMTWQQAKEFQLAMELAKTQEAQAKNGKVLLVAPYMFTLLAGDNVEVSATTQSWKFWERWEREKR